MMERLKKELERELKKSFIFYVIVCSLSLIGGISFIVYALVTYITATKKEFVNDIGVGAFFVIVFGFLFFCYLLPLYKDLKTDESERYRITKIEVVKTKFRLGGKHESSYRSALVKNLDTLEEFELKDQEKRLREGETYYLYEAKQSSIFLYESCDFSNQEND